MRTRTRSETTTRRCVTALTLTDGRPRRQPRGRKSVQPAQSTSRAGNLRPAGGSRRELVERVPAEHGEVELHALTGVLEVGAGEQADPPEALADRVAVQEQRAGHRVHAPVSAQE